MKQELRTLNVSIRAAAKDDLLELHGTAVSYNVLSQDLGGFRERFLPGAFTRSLASGTDVKCLFNHSQNHVLGRTQNGTLQLFDTPEGLNFCCKLDPNQQAHRDLHASVKRGDINECSFAFRPTSDGEDWDDVSERGGAKYIRRTVKQASLYDCSVVTTPAYNAPGATSVVARSRVVTPARPSVTDQQLRARLERTGKDVRRMMRKVINEFETDQQLRSRLDEVGRQIRAEVTAD